MRIEDILDSEISQEQIEDRIIREGNNVFQTIKTPGWELILGALMVAKINAVKARKKAMAKEANREMCFYWNGIYDGIEEAIESVNDVVRSAENVRNNRKNRQQSEEE